MDSLVSVIIPNYNEEKHIKKCLDSVLGQTYQNIEIIVVDDGSTDESVRIIENYIAKCSRMQLVRQFRQNAAIARNEGMKIAKGEYYLFLDSDDMLYPNAIEILVNAAINKEVDFVIGNMKEMDEEDNITNELVLFDKDEVISDYKELIGLIPAPSNKFFKASVIKDNHLCFGNVRIGQDLNFFLKYLACCNRICKLSQFVYAWRDTTGSMSRTVNFKIFDIVESFRDIHTFYIARNMSEDYINYIRMIEYHHYYRQMDKQMKFPDRKSKKLVIDYFRYSIRELGDVTKCYNFQDYSSEYKMCRLKLRFAFLYTTEFFKAFYMKKNAVKN